MTQNSSAAKKTEAPVNLLKWVEENRHRLKPPVSNGYLYDGEDFFIMMVAGPNARNDFHVTDSEEFFYQIKGNIVVRIIENGEIKDMPVREGETFFIPGGVPHSPTRPPNTLGMVIERRRPEGELEHLQFYCDNCHALVHDLEFDCADIVEHFSQAMKEFWADEKLSTCKECGTRVPEARPVKEIHFNDQIAIEREL